ncbi:hypothetical protein V1505DRAFT_152349 [Lipomyces doorenjongii]
MSLWGERNLVLRDGMRSVDSPLDLSIFGTDSLRLRPPSPESGSSGSSGTRSENNTPMATPAPAAAASAKSKSSKQTQRASSLVDLLTLTMEQDREEKKARSEVLLGYAEVKRIEAQNVMASIELERFKFRVGARDQEIGSRVSKAAARDFTSTSGKEVVVLVGQSICSQAVIRIVILILS